MTAKRPGWKIPETGGDVPKTLMGNQDTKHKGDSASALHRKKNRQLNCWVTAEQKARYSAYAESHDMSLSRLIIEGLELRIKQD